MTQSDRPDSSALGVVLGAAAGGFLAWFGGRAEFREWEAWIAEYKARGGHLAYFKVIKPLAALDKIANGDVFYRQALQSYLSGSPDASVAMSVKCLELTLKEKHKQQLGNTKYPDLQGLIDWAEQFLDTKKELAHGFRHLRNLIHESTPVKEQIALEAVSHVSDIMNRLFPYSTVEQTVQCAQCGRENKVSTPMDQYQLLNVLNLPCQYCNTMFPVTVF